MIYNQLNMSHDFSKAVLLAGEKLYKDNKVTITNVRGFSYENSKRINYEIKGNVKEGPDAVRNVSFIIGNGIIEEERCRCLQEGKRYIPYWDIARRRCKHIAAVLYALKEYVYKHPECVEVEPAIKQMIIGYERDTIARTIIASDEKVELEPILEKWGTSYRVSFKIGYKKKYVIKNLYDFAQYMKTGEKIAYGKDLEIIHHMDGFTEKSKELASFILAKVEENRAMLEEMDYYSYGRVPQKRQITLTPSILDDFWQIIEGETITLVDKDAESKKEGTKKFHLVKKNPTIPVTITRFCMNTMFGDEGEEPEKEERDTPFPGITVKVNTNGYLEGKQYGYVFMEQTLYQTDHQFKEIMQDFLKTMQQEEGCFIGQQYIPRFYNEVIHKIRKYIDLDEYNQIEIASVLPPDPEFTIYLDKYEENVLCRAAVVYGEQEFNLYDDSKEHEMVANRSEEFKVVSVINHFLPYVERASMVNHCNGEEDTIYELLNHGIESLLQCGEVFVSETLQRMKVRSSPNITVGVSMKHNLLDLTLDTGMLDSKELSEILKSYHMKKRYHRLTNGDFLQLEDNAITTLSEVMESMHLSIKDLTKGKMHIPAYRAIYLDKILQESEGIHYERDRKVKDMLRNFKAVEDSEYEIPKELDHVLRPYQKVGYQWLRMMEDYQFGGILADDMGLGKTLQVITVLLSAKQEQKRGCSLIVCPASLIYNWESECKQFAPELVVQVITGTVEERSTIIEEAFSKKSIDVLVTSYDLLKRDIDLYENKTFLYEIIDEAQYIKNQTTQGAKAVKLIHAKTRFALTGTPIENRLSELWSIFDFLMPGFLYRYEQFKKELEIPIAKSQDEERMKRLKRMVSPFILRRLKKDVLKDLPAKLEQITYAKMTKEQRSIYTAYTQKVKEQLATQTEEEFSSNKLKILAELTRLRQICCDPSLIYDNYTEESAKLSTCMELLHNAVDGNHKVLLFSQFTSMLALIEKRLKEEKISYYKITGATKKEERMKLVNQYNEDDTTVFLISLKAGGTGLNLASADVVIHYDPWWNIAAQNQATDRAHRIGQKNVVTVFKLIAQDTIEEKIVKMQEEKKDLADQIISEETNQLQNMTREDFEELLQL
ncbi:SNF2 helicase associated domain-containing protein [Anaerosporobacter faecicola]|uniref:SNF2 helicase associated domain-containing protein n=1 Tax=Anaerosporobacter faecicola TaxID=2718714 RepID=UPI0014399B57|nr:SNF2 helicase associated domain-containing protein [Anaerosporobacter faecicola]